VKVFNERRSLAEGEGQIQLKAVGGAGDVCRFSRSSVLQFSASAGLRCLRRMVRCLTVRMKQYKQVAANYGASLRRTAEGGCPHVVRDAPNAWLGGG
jgi:hypothetical protein